MLRSALHLNQGSLSASAAPSIEKEKEEGSNGQFDCIKRAADGKR